MQDRKQDEIRNTPLFRSCSAAQVRWIAKVADTLDVPSGFTLARCGATSREFIVIVSGGASTADGRTLIPGAHIGADGLLDDGPHAADVVTSARTRLLVFAPGAFRGMLHQVPAVARKLLADKVIELRAADQTVRSLRAVS